MVCSNVRASFSAFLLLHFFDIARFLMDFFQNIFFLLSGLNLSIRLNFSIRKMDPHPIDRNSSSRKSHNSFHAKFNMARKVISQL